ncbi:DVU0524 family FlgM-associated protein [Thermodesulforhabdus norvegica]|uniref:Uncharacterized protein n=1 Tax=Thermodesulforhabdus norvegica TaxID=39841 RepID=A0A1I4UNG1_9BACT|nr:DVU0524 family FlgM-associated protein [Thermodesulforhabdus norvegica]SFM90529.1 hypothetical protein SAMN05660836_01896 [Thermodesulforhabdus norvegica]
MIITDHRVKSVLRTYANQLRQSKLPREKSSGSVVPSGEKITISEEAKKRLVFDRLTKHALEQAKALRSGDSEDSAEGVESSDNAEEVEGRDQPAVEKANL